MECAIEEKHLQQRKTFAVNWIAHDFLAEANRPRRAVFAVRGDWERLPPHRRAFGREPEFGDTSLIMQTAA